MRRGARVVEWAGLENRNTRKCIVGSNPTLSANKKATQSGRFFMNDPRIIEPGHFDSSFDRMTIDPTNPEQTGLVAAILCANVNRIHAAIKALGNRAGDIRKYLAR